MEPNYTQDWQLTSIANKTASYNEKQHSVQVKDAETSIDLKSHLQIEAWAERNRVSEHDRNTLGLMLDNGLTKEAQSQTEELKRFEVATMRADGTIANTMKTDDPDVAMRRFHDLVLTKACGRDEPGAHTALKDMELKLDASYLYEGKQNYTMAFGKEAGRVAYGKIESEPYQKHANLPAPQAKEAQPAAQTIGDQMPKGHWTQAAEVLRNISRSDRVNIYLPRPGGEYAGKMIAMTDTHLVQQVGKTSAVAHTLSSLKNGQEIARNFDDRKLKPNAQLVIKYGQAQEKGLVETRSFEQTRASEAHGYLSEWAQKNITNVKSREAFLKHLQAGTQDMAKQGQERPQNEPQRQQARQPAPQLQRDR